MTRLLWLRNDLRLADNPALYHACKGHDKVRVIYCATPEQSQAHHESVAQLAFRQGLLTSLARQLTDIGVPLDILHCPSFAHIPALILQYCQQHKINSLWFNDQSWFNEQLRDERVEQALAIHDINCHRFSDEMLVNQPILTKTEQPYRVFTAWYRQWLSTLLATHVSLLPPPAASRAAINIETTVTLALDTEPSLTTQYRDDIWPPCQQHAISQLIEFCQSGAIDYANNRDYPGIKGTSLLSPYLACGAISIRQCYIYLQQSCLEHQAPWPDNTWLKELGWREFYRYLMIHNPDIAKGKAFNASKEPRWIDNPQHFSAWQQGQTGFPLVDAAMRQLQRTGWMHNRLRMLSASFLCKLLLIDWRQGEQHFMQLLIDADFSSNNGGWQWSASIGCDATPWFRIFNPTTQSTKFDAKGTFIRKMLPELASLSDKDIHCPTAEQRQNLGYPQPIIDYKEARARALNWLK
jgi:deoxyribodipyrimidine photo-lyase